MAKTNQDNGARRVDTMAEQLSLPEDGLTQKASAIKNLSLGLLIAAGLGAIILAITWLFNPAVSIISIIILRD